MSRIKLLKNLGAVAVLAIGASTGLSAQTGTLESQRTEIQRADLSGAPGMEIVSSTVEVKPGEGVELHFHHGIEAFYVLQGGRLEYPDGRHVDLATGTSKLNLREVRHGGYKNVGNTTIKFFTVHVVDKARPLYNRGP
jgi:quercetin dioxygenase-like cupin family protein